MKILTRLRLFPFALCAFVCSSIALWGQTNPAPQNLPLTQNFGTSTFTTMPNGFAAWNGINGGNVTSQATAESSVPTGDATLTTLTALPSSEPSGGMRSLAVAGNARPVISISANATNGVNQLAMAFSTLGQSSVTLSYTIESIFNGNRVLGLVAQYRVGTTGSWTTLANTSAEFSASFTVGTTQQFSTVLPLNALNQANIQVRWAVWRFSPTGATSNPSIAIDDISVVGQQAAQTLDIPLLLAPVHLSQNVDIAPQFSWQSVSSATSYQLQVSTNAQFTSSDVLQTLSSTSFSPITALQPVTQYFWKVRANNSSTTSDWSSVFSFTTQNISLAAPILISPTNGTQTFATTATLSWNAVPSATSYRVQVSTQPTYSNLLSESIISATQLVISLPTGSPIFWRVQAISATTTSSFSNGFFSVLLASPQLISPNASAANVGLTEQFTISSVVGASGYLVQISTNALFSTVVFAQSQPSTVFSPTTLQPLTTYFWRAQAFTASTTSDWSAVQQFQTQTAPLTSPILLAPANSTSEVSVNPILRWTAVQYASSYRVQVSTSASFATLIFNQQTTATQTFLSVPSGSTIFWRVQALAQSTASSFSVASFSTQTFKINYLSSYRTGIYLQSAAEIAEFDPISKQVFMISSVAARVDVISIQNPSFPQFIRSIDCSPWGGAVNSVDVRNGIVAVAVEDSIRTNAGRVVFFTTNGNYLHNVKVGAQPDMVGFSPDGTIVATADEGEPSGYGAGYVDPEGSVSLIRIGNGVTNATVETVPFGKWNSRKDILTERGVRIYGINSTVAQDLEPEYVAFSADQKTLYATLQENNALAIIDVATGQVRDIVPFGWKDHSKPVNALDPSDRDGVANAGRINIRNVPVRSLFLPDGLAAFQSNGKTFLATANEGDGREWPGLTEEVRISDASIVLDPSVFPNASEIKNNANLGRLRISTASGKNAAGQFRELYAAGGRSFSIWDENGNLVFDSGEEFERITAERVPAFFNNAPDANGFTFDGRSGARGPEAEGIVVGTIDNRTFAFIGLERTGGVMIYDISTPSRPAFVDYVNTVNFAGTVGSGTAGDVSPEGLLFIPANESPNGRPMLVVANEMSGSLAFFEMNLNSLTPALAVPTRNAPLLGEANVGNNRIIEWNRVSGASRYDWQISTIPNFDSRFIADGGSTTATSGLLQNVQPNTFYFWRARAFSTGATSGVSAWSETGSFFSGALPTLQLSTSNPDTVCPGTVRTLRFTSTDFTSTENVFSAEVLTLDGQVLQTVGIARGADARAIEIQIPISLRPGEYRVRVTASHPQTASVSARFVIKSPLAAKIVVVSDSTCSGGGIRLQAQPAGAVYLWSNGANSREISVRSSGEVSVLIIDPLGCSGSTSSTMILELPRAPKILGSSSVTICAGTNTELRAESGFSRYLWSNGATSVSIIVQTSGTYFVTAFTASGCSSQSLPVRVSVKTASSLTIDAIANSSSGTVSICEGDQIPVSASSGFVSYQWSNGQNSRAVVLSSSGNYTVSGTTQDGCITTASLTLRTIARPSKPILNVENGEIVITSALPSGAKIEWFRDGVLLPQFADISKIRPTVSGKYIAKITVENLCSASSDERIVSLTSVEENNFISEIGYKTSLFPNPCSEELFIQLNATSDIEIFSVSGEKVMSMRGETGEIRLNVQTLSNGFYVVRITNLSGLSSEIHRIVKF